MPAGMGSPVMADIFFIMRASFLGSEFSSSMPENSLSISDMSPSMALSSTGGPSASLFSFALPVTAKEEIMRSMGNFGLSGQRGVFP